VAGRVDEVELIVAAVLRAIIQPDGVGLDGDPAFSLQVHVIQHLVGHLSGGEGAGELEDAIRQCGFAVVDMGDDGEIADVGERLFHICRLSG